MQIALSKMNQIIELVHLDQLILTFLSHKILHLLWKMHQSMTSSDSASIHDI